MGDDPQLPIIPPRRGDPPHVIVTVFTVKFAPVPSCGAAFVRMMVLVSVLVPVGSVMVSGATDTGARFATPVPVSVTTAGPTVAPVYATVSVRLYAVWFVGANTTLMVHDAPTANVAAPLAGQVPPAVPVGREKRCGNGGRNLTGKRRDRKSTRLN